MNSITWHTPPQSINLTSAETHIWRAWLDDQYVPTDTLTRDELQRGSRFVREIHRHRFCRARVYLRQILALYLKINPATIRFREGPQGKLYLADGTQRLQFNVSHSQGLAVYAVTREHEVGIDAEWISPDLEVMSIIHHFFPYERDKVLSLAADQQRKAFYRLWTCKEAWLKSRGWGLGKLSQAPTENDPFNVINFEPAQGYAGALAYAGNDGPINNQLSYFKISG